MEPNAAENAWKIDLTASVCRSRGIAMAAGSSSKKVIYAALAGNLLIALTKFTAAGWTGSSAMLSEGVHSLVDTGNQGLMLYGIHRAAKPPDDQHPLGHGRELYFWCFIVALLIFSLGAGVSFYEGILHLQNPVVIVDPTINYVVLGVSFVFEAASWWIALREFDRHRGAMGYFEAATRSRDPTTFLVLFEDTAALIGIAIAFAGTLAAERLEIPELDGVASIGIGIVLAATAVFLARESKGLLIGEPAREPTRQSILKIAREHSGVGRVGRLITVHLAPQQIVAIVDIDFADELSAAAIESTASTLEREVKDRHPDVIALFINPKGVSPTNDAVPRQGDDVAAVAR
jgi:cation diffusion facilitator family transporter